MDVQWLGGGDSLIIPDFSAMSVGSTFLFGKYQVGSETPWAIEWEIVHQTEDYQIAQTKQIIDLRCFDAAEPTNINSNRASKGNNNWSVSNIKQFLNSDKESWYSAQHQYDAPPNSSNTFGGYNPYDTHKGFLYYFSDEEKNLLKDMTFDLAIPAVDGGGSYSWTGKVWLPTLTQIGISKNNNIDEGYTFDKYIYANSDRSIIIKTINKYCAKNNELCIANDIHADANCAYWLSSENPSQPYVVRVTEANGGTYDTGDNAYSPVYGLAPCICLPRK